MASTDAAITTSGFYGSKNKRKCIGLERAIDNVVKKHQTEKIPKKFPSRILGPPTKWQIFHRQQDAFRCAKSTSKDLHVFAFESESFMENTGQRLYLVASYPVFWHYYSQLGQDKRHHYEVIPEGAVCKLYFDLEFDMTVNPDSNGPVMVKILVQYVCLCMESIFRIKCTSDDFLDLDASTEKKFSRHLIWQVKTAAFKDNIHAGRFVCSIISRIFEKLKQNKAEETDCDRSCVVTKCDPASDKDVLNNFTNQGQSVVNCNVDNLDSQINDKEDCQGSETESKNSNENPIVDHIDRVIEKFDKEDLKKLIVKNKDGDDVSFCDLGVYTKNRNFRLVLSSKLHKNNPLLLSDHITTYRQVSGDIDVKKMFEDSLVANVRYCNGLKILAFDEEYSSSSLTLTRRRKDTLNTQEFLGGYSKSPYPEVDEYIIGLITENAGKGVIRHWTYFHQGELLVYEIAKYRYCHNVGRHHKSNNIMLVADLQKGVLYQKCHDPDCHMQNYKSPEWPLPRNVLPANYFDEADDLDQEIDDAELLNSVTEIENQYMKQSREQPDLFELEDGDDEELVAAAVQLDRSLNENS